MIPKPLFRLSTGILWIFLLMNVLLMSCATIPVDHPETENPEASSSMLLDVYRGPLNHLSAVRRGPCPMHPSCSEYARQAMAKHGRIKGWLMATDRLMRCGRDETRLVPKVRVNGRIKYYDPVDNNDFWWVKK